MNYYIGIDVGSASVRSAIYNENGIEIIKYSNPINIYKNIFNDIITYEQNSENIYESIIICLNNCINYMKNNIDNFNIEDIRGIGIDATCSLVYTLKNKSINNNENDIIMWLDHRAINETNFINSTKHSVLNYVGNNISVEMEMPKILWIYNNNKELYNNIDQFFDLADYLVYKLTNSLKRSLNCVICKWNYIYDINNDNIGWDASFLNEIGLLNNNILDKIGHEFTNVGELIDKLNHNSINDFNLSENTIVSSGIIDAYAGLIGSLFLKIPNNNNNNNNSFDYNYEINHRMVMIAGTSSCFMFLSNNSLNIPNVWGPYYSVGLPDYYITEAGQSIAGKAIDYIIENHNAYNLLKEKANEYNISIYLYLEYILLKLCNQKNIHINNIDILTKDIFILPEFCGNRSPIGNPMMKGCFLGITLNNTIENLALLYLSTIQGITYSSKQIIEHVELYGHERKDKIIITGGLTNNSLFLSSHATILQRTIIIPPNNIDTVLLGSSMLASCGYNQNLSIFDIMNNMSNEGYTYESFNYNININNNNNNNNLFSELLQNELNKNQQYIKLNESKIINYHQIKYQIYLEMQDRQLYYQNKLDNIL